MLIIPQEKPSVLAAITWGIAPGNKKVEEVIDYYKEAAKFGKCISVSSEKAFDHFLYKQSIYKKGCIIPISAFFEPHVQNGNKYPFVFKPKVNSFLSLAGIYTRIENKVTFAILIQKSSLVILNDKQVSQWLYDDLPEDQIENL